MQSRPSLFLLAAKSRDSIGAVIERFTSASHDNRLIRAAPGWRGGEEEKNALLLIRPSNLGPGCYRRGMAGRFGAALTDERIDRRREKVSPA